MAFPGIRLPGWARWTLKVAVTAAAILLIARRLDFADLWSTLRGVRWELFILCALLQYGVAGLNALRWKVLVPLPGVRLNKYLYYVFVGHFLNFFMPSAALAEGARAYAFGRRYGGVQKNFVAALVSRAAGLMVMLLMAAAAFWCSGTHVADLPVWSRLGLRRDLLACAAAALAVGGCVGLVFFRARLASVWGDLRAYASDRRMLARMVAVSVLIQAAMIVTTILLFGSLHWSLPLWQAAFIPAMVQVLLLLPVSVGGVGVREYLNVAFYAGLAGAPMPVIVASSLLSYLPMLALAATGGVWVLYRKKDAAEASTGVDEGNRP